MICNKQHRKGWKQCENCHMCSFSCRCRKRPKFLPGLKSLEVEATKNINTLPRAISVEIEASNWGEWASSVDNLPNDLRIFLVPKFRHMRDTSVSSEEEIVVGPTTGDAFLQTMTGVCLLMNNAGVEMDETCGYHVHINASDYNSLAIRNLLIIWSRYEDEMTGKLFSKKRKANKFCSPINNWVKEPLWVLRAIKQPQVLRTAFNYMMYHLAWEYDSECGQIIDNSDWGMYGRIRDRLIDIGCKNIQCKSPRDSLPVILQWIGNNRITDLSNIFRSNNCSNSLRNHYCVARYMALNIASLFYRGSIEFRVHEGTTDGRDMLMWPLFCGWMTHIAANESPSSVMKMMDTMSLSEFVEHKKAKGVRLFPESVADWVRGKLNREIY